MRQFQPSRAVAQGAPGPRGKPGAARQKVANGIVAAMSVPVPHPDSRWPWSALRPTGRIVTPDAVGVAYYDLGGEGPPLLLVHATGFCGAVLAPLASHLRPSWHCVALDLRAHGRSDRPADGHFGWQGFARDIAAVVDHLALDRPAGVGHSCGGASLLLAEEAAPGTFRALYCYEPIVYPGLEPLAPSLEANPLAAVALRRRAGFASRADALANYAAKAPFDRLAPSVLAAYVDNAFTPDDGAGIRLRCRPDDEAQVYAHAFSHPAFAHLQDVACPVTLACGAETDAIGPEFLARYAQRLARPTTLALAGLGHFGPLEDPGAVARSVHTSLVDPRRAPRA